MLDEVRAERLGYIHAERPLMSGRLVVRRVGGVR